MRRIFRLSSNPPSLLPQRESGSLLPVIINKIGVFILMRAPGKAIRNYYENRLFSFFIRGLGRTSAILTAVGIQNPFPHPTWFVSAGMFQLGRQPVHPASLSCHNRLGT